MKKSIFALTLALSLTSNVILAQETIKKSPNEIHVLSNPDVVKQLGIEQKDLVRYITAVETAFKEEFKAEAVAEKDKGVLLELAIYPIREENPMVCEKNYKNCVMMEIKNTIVGGVDEKSMELFGKKLMEIDEVKVMNNRSQSKLNIVLYLNLSKTPSGLNFKVLKPTDKPVKKKKSDDDYLKNA